RWVERPYEILIRSNIDGGLSPDARVGHCKQRRWEIGPSNSPHVNRRDEASYILNNATANGQNPTLTSGTTPAQFRNDPRYCIQALRRLQSLYRNCADACRDEHWREPLVGEHYI